MVMKKHIVHNSSLCIHKKINIQKTHKMKNKTKYQTNISYQETKESYLSHLKREHMRNESEKNEFMSNFLSIFLKQKTKEDMQKY